MSNIVDIKQAVPASPFDNVFAQIAEAAASGLRSGGFPRLKLDNGRFVVVRGEEEELLKTLEIDLIVVDAIPNLVRKFYSRAYAGNGEAVAPCCQSTNGVTPTGGDKKQSETCAECPQNVWGTSRGPDGKLGDGKACAERKQLAVYLHESREVLGLEVPPTSLKNFQQYVSYLSNHGRMLPKVITRVGTDIRKESGNAILTFAFSGDIIEPAALEKVVELFNSAEVKRITKPEGNTVALSAPVDTPRLESDPDGQAQEQEQEQEQPAKPAKSKSAPPKPAKPAKSKSAPSFDGDADDNEDDSGSGSRRAQPTAQKRQPAQDAFLDDEDDDLARALDLDI